MCQLETKPLCFCVNNRLLAIAMESLSFCGNPLPSSHTHTHGKYEHSENFVNASLHRRVVFVFLPLSCVPSEVAASLSRRSCSGVWFPNLQLWYSFSHATRQTRQKVIYLPKLDERNSKNKVFFHSFNCLFSRSHHTSSYHTSTFSHPLSFASMISSLVSF